MTTETPCRGCRTEAKRDAQKAAEAAMEEYFGEPVTEEDLRDWSLWGCTCDPADLADAMAFMSLVTR